MSDAPAPQPGWYADPENPAAERWWNGSGWSEQQRPATQTPAPPAASPLVSPPLFPAPVAPAPGVPAPGAPVPGASAPGSLDTTGFTFGASAGVAGRPDPYAPPPPSPAQPYYGAYSPYGAQPVSTVNGLALAGLLVSCFGWIVVSAFGPIVGIILSILGLSQATKREQQGLPNPGRGLAIAGIAVGGGLLALGVLLFVTLMGITFAAQ